MTTESATAPWIPPDTFGSRLALVRQALGGLNVTRIAELCGIDPATWRNWESGRTHPQRFEEASEQIARMTGCDLVWLRSGYARRPDLRVTDWEHPRGTVTDWEGEVEQLSLPFRHLRAV